MDFSIIIVNYNTKNLLKNCLDSIFNNFNKDDFEVIVVDNNSNDKSIEMLKRYGDIIKVVENQKNFGFGKANNIGTKVAQGEYLFFLNSDTIIHSNILSKINSEFESDNSVGIVSPKLILNNGKQQEHAYGKFPNLLNIIVAKFKKQKFSNHKNFEVDWVSGAALIVRKNIFKEVKGFDNKFFMYFEDIDLCKKVKRLNYKIVVLNKVKILHLGGKSIKKTGIRKRYYHHSQNYYFKKNFGIFMMILLKIIRWPYKLLKNS